MAIKLNQSLKQSQQLAMTPQLQQAIKMLTLTHLEMTNVIAQEMTENPMLEEAGLEVDPQAESKEVDKKLEKLEGQNEEATSDSFDSDQLTKSKDDFDWEKYISSFNSTSSSSPPSMAKPDPDAVPNYENMVSEGDGLADHLEWQLRMENLTQQEWALAEQIIYNLKDDGYLDVHFEDIIAQTGHDPEDAYEILAMIKRLDPVGCGSSSLEECLLAQAQLLEERSPLLEKVIENHLQDLQQQDYEGIGKALGVPGERVRDAHGIIVGLNPKPGKLVSKEEAQYVVPDIFIQNVGGKLVVNVNDDGVPRLKISQLYQSIMKQQKEGETKDFIQEKLKSAMWLIKAIQNRQKTIVKVAEAIVRYQPEFFHKGPQHLKPMILRDIASEIGVHESTVSRVTTNKYMHTPIGTYELKYFFNSGVGGKNGGVDIASESLKHKIKQMVDNESKKRPLSDQKIVELLGRGGVQIARRTVAKYRDILNIPSSSKRKKKN